MAKSINFREDINGLRAIAVICVLIFHFMPEKLSGGFVGVDIFFVISGYLMTAIIFKGLANHSFFFWTYLANRAKRIAPALITTVLAVLLLGYAALGPDAYKIMAKHARDSLLFISNITYEKESGYFDASSNTKFFLHTWSLSVEWQFYLIYPIILLFFKRFLSLSTLKLVVVGLLIISLLASILITQYKPETAYFMFYSRGWEMMFGGLAFLYPLYNIKNRTRFFIELIGISIIIFSIIKMSVAIPWPGYMALIPVIGTYLCILANNQNTILSGYVINKVGLWSYSLYLVHWPLLVFTHTLNLNLSLTKYFIIVFILAFMLYQLVEKRRQYKWGLLFFYIITLLLAVYIRNTQGVEQRLASIPEASKESLKQGNLGWRTQEWLLFNANDASNKLAYIFYGDSFSAQYASYFMKQSKSLANFYEGECLSTPNFYSYSDVCKNLYEKLKINIQKNPSKTLVIAQSWERNLAGLKDKITSKPVNYSVDDFIIAYEKELNIIKKELDVDKIVLIGLPHYSVGAHPKKCLLRQFYQTLYDQYFDNNIECMDQGPIQPNIIVFNEKLQQLSKKEDWLFFINPNDAICNNGLCIQMENNLSLYADEGHFSTVGADRVGKFIFEQLKEIDNK